MVPLTGYSSQFSFNEIDKKNHDVLLETDENNSKEEPRWMNIIFAITLVAVGIIIAVGTIIFLACDAPLFALAFAISGLATTIPAVFALKQQIADSLKLIAKAEAKLEQTKRNAEESMRTNAIELKNAIENSERAKQEADAEVERVTRKYAAKSEALNLQMEQYRLEDEKLREEDLRNYQKEMRKIEIEQRNSMKT